MFTCRILFFVAASLLAGSAYAQQRTLREYLDRKQYADVLARADSLSPADSADYGTMFAVAQAAEGLLHYPLALRYYQHCLALDSTLTETWNALARTAALMGRTTDAERFFQHVLAADSLNFYANLQLARLYYQSGEYGKALVKYAQLQANDVQNPVLWQAIGDCYTKQELPSEAAIAYFKAFEYNPGHAGLAHALVNTLLRLGGDFIAEAIAVSDTALFYNPGHRQLLRNKGMALYMSRQYAESDTLFSQLLAEGDSSYLTLKYAGASKYNAGMYLASIEPLEIAYEKDTTSVEVCLLLGSALGKTYDRRRAFALLEQAEKAMQPNPFWLTQLSLFRAETYNRAGKRLEASRLYYDCWKKQPDRLDILYSLRNIYGASAIKEYPTDNDRARGVFVELLYTTRYLEKNKPSKKEMVFQHSLFRSLYEDLFFRGQSEQPLIAPDGAKSSLSLVDLRSLLNQLEQLPDE